MPGRTLTAALGLALGSAAAHAQTQPLPRAFAIDAAHSSVAFKVGFMGFGTVTGEFQEFAGALLIGATPEQSAVGAVIQTKSISSRSKSRDDHLRSPDFLAADSFPLITFHSTRITRRGDGWIAHGPLSIRGVTRTIALPFTPVHALNRDAWGNSRVTYRALTRLSRRDYNIRGTAFWNSEFDPGRVAVADSVTIELEISATVPNTARWTVPRTDSLVSIVEAAGVDRLIADVTAGRDGPVPLTPDQLAVTAYKLLQRNRTDAAIHLFEWVLQRHADSPVASLAASIVAEAQLNRGARADAIRNFRLALAIDPHDPIASTWLRYLGEKLVP